MRLRYYDPRFIATVYGLFLLWVIVIKSVSRLGLKIGPGQRFWYRFLGSWITYASVK